MGIVVLGSFSMVMPIDTTITINQENPKHDFYITRLIVNVKFKSMEKKDIY